MFTEKLMEVHESSGLLGIGKLYGKVNIISTNYLLHCLSLDALEAN